MDLGVPCKSSGFAVAMTSVRRFGIYLGTGQTPMATECVFNLRIEKKDISERLRLCGSSTP
jgi:hypothetical protein